MDLHLYALEQYATVYIYSEDPWLGVRIYMQSLFVFIALYVLGDISFLFLSGSLFFRQLFLFHSLLSLRINRLTLPDQLQG